MSIVTSRCLGETTVALDQEFEDGTVMLTDAAGKPLPGEFSRRKLGHEDDEIVIARQLLRSKAL